MSQQQKVIEVLKKLMKTKGILYKDLARELDVSLPTIKRIFSENELSLSRLERICHILNVQMTDVFQLVETDSEDVPHKLTLEQEEHLARKPQRLAYLELLLAGMKPQQIEKKFNLSPTYTARVLADLEKWDLIVWLPGNKVKCRMARQIQLLTDGPLLKLLHEKGIKEFLNSTFKGDLEQQNFATFEASEKTLEKMQVDLQRILREAMKQGRLEGQSGIPVISVGAYVASRPFGTVDMFGL